MANKIEIIISATDKASGTIDGFGKKIGGQFQSIGRAALAGAAVVATAIGGMSLAIGKLALDATVYDSQRKAFRTMTEGIVGDIDEFLANVKDMSAGTMSNAEIMSSALETFGMIGTAVFTDFENDYASTVEMARRTGRALGKDTAEVMDIITNAVATGNTEYLRQLGIQLTITDAQKWYAESIGKSIEELTEAERKTAIYELTMLRLGESFGDVATTSGGLGTQLAQTKAWFEDLKTEVGMGVMPVMSQLGEIILPVVKAATEALVADGLQKFTAAMVPVVAAVAELITSLMDGTHEIYSFIDSVKTTFAPIAKFISDNVKLQDVLIVLGVAIASVVIPALWSIITAAAPVIAVFVAAIAIVALLRQAWESDFLGIQTITKEVLDNIRQWWAENGEAIMAKAQEIWDAVVAVFQWFVDYYTMLFQAFSLAFAGDWEGFGAKLREIWDMVWETIRGIGEKAWDAIKTFFLTTDWGAIGRAILQGIANGIIAGATLIRDAALAAARAAFDAVKGFFGIGSPSKLMAGIGKNLMEGMAVGIGGASSLPEGAMARAASSVVNNVKNMTVNVNSQQSTGSLYRDLALVEAML